MYIGIIIITIRDVISVAPPQPYEPPFFDVVGERPTLEIMKEAVVHGKHRPLILPNWTIHNVSKSMSYQLGHTVKPLLRDRSLKRDFTVLSCGPEACI